MCFLHALQAAVIHQSVFKFLHIDDQDMVKTNLAWPKPAEKKVKLVSGFLSPYCTPHRFNHLLQQSLLLHCLSIDLSGSNLKFHFVANVLNS